VLLQMEDPDAVNARRKALTEKGIARTYAFLLKWQSPGLDDALIETLQRYGNRKMCDAFLNSGVVRLYDAAHSWATAHDFELIRLPGD
jgi:hypothetical protein